MPFESDQTALLKKITNLTETITNDVWETISQYAVIYINHIYNNRNCHEDDPEVIRKSIRDIFNINENTHPGITLVVMIGLFVGVGIVKNGPDNGLAITDYEETILLSILSLLMPLADDEDVYAVAVFIHDYLGDAFVKTIKMRYAQELVSSKLPQFASRASLATMDFFQAYFIQTEEQYDKVESYYDQLKQLLAVKQNL